MKKLIIKIGNETHELPYNNEVFSFEVSDKYVPNVGDCVMTNWDEPGYTTFFKIMSIDNDGDIMAESSVDLNKGKYIIDLDELLFLYETNFTQITQEELKAKYAEAGYDWDYETNEVKPLKWMPKVGDCVKISFKDSKFEYFGKISQIVKKEILLKSSVNEISGVILNLSSYYDYRDIFLTQITPEELKAKYAEAGYDWDYESDTVKPLKWMPKDRDEVWYLSDDLTIVNGFYNENFYYLLEKDLLFPTFAECLKFADHCLKYFDKK